MENKTENGHVLWKPSDFTDEQIADEALNGLVTAVFEGGLSVCKVCGEYEAGLDNPCGPKNGVGEGVSLKKFWFTFGSGHCDAHGASLGNAVAVVEAESEGEARKKMFEARGGAWFTSYTSAEEAGVQRFGLVELSLEEVSLVDKGVF